MSRAALVFAGTLGIIALSFCSATGAAELVPPARASQSRAGCGRCGCLNVVYEYHRELLSSYGLNFDPRSYDTTEPHFYVGRMRAFPRYFVDGAVADRC
jgi:hypothetical protein